MAGSRYCEEADKGVFKARASDAVSLAVNLEGPPTWNDRKEGQSKVGHPGF